MASDGGLERWNAERVALEREIVRQKSLVDASHSLHSTLDQDELLGIHLETTSKATYPQRGTSYLMLDCGREI